MNGLIEEKSENRANGTADGSTQSGSERTADSADSGTDESNDKVIEMYEEYLKKNT